jgi:iron complex transport system substrate-binding protein
VLTSATEIVCALGLQRHLEGVSHECDYPARLADLPIVNNTAIPKGLDSKAIDEKVRELLQTDAALYHLNVDALLVLKQTYIVT